MATNVIMPKLGMTMTEGTIIKWHKKVGDAIAVSYTHLTLPTM